MMLELPGFQEMHLLNELDKHFFRFTSTQYDRELSLLILGRLVTLFSDEEIETFGNLLNSFVDMEYATLRRVFEDYADDDRRSPLLFQPESIAIFLCIKRDRSKLRAVWEQFMPIALLVGLAEVWGEDVGVMS